MKILLILENSPSPFGGIERHCYNLLELFKNDKSFELETLSKSDIKYRYIKGINKIVFDKNDLEQKIKKSEADIVHIHGFASFTVVQSINCAYKLGKKIVYTAHYHPFETLDHPFLGKMFFIFFLKNILKKVSLIITINKEDSKFFRKFSSNVIMIPHWLNQRNILQKKINRNIPMILFVGRLDSNKGIDHLYSLPQGKYEIHCVSNGIIERSDFIQHKNISDKDLFLLYEAASVLVVPSRYEAFSYAALEALFSGCPVVLSDRVRIGDYLEHLLGLGVEVFKYGDYNAFEDAIDKSLKKIVDCNKVDEIFNTEQIKQKYKQLYLNLL